MAVCVNCGDFKANQRLYIKYNNNSYKLLDCDKCGKVIDKYIEYDNLNLLINIILLKRGVYRHLVYNNDNNVANKRLKYIILSFEVYITWVYQEHLHHFLSLNSTSNGFIREICSSKSIMDSVFDMDAFWQYCFFIQYCFIDQWLMLRIINFKFSKRLYLEKQKNDHSLIVFENTLLLSYISRLVFPILMFIWPYDDSIIIPSFIIKWLTNYYLIESINLILYSKNDSPILNNLVLLFSIVFTAKVFILNIIMNAASFTLTSTITMLAGKQPINVNMFDGYRVLKDLFYQFALG
ncbi:hypothetical protein QEN19_001953 [Hanseniaspora menglaensis]